MDNWMENFQFYPPLYTHDSIIHFLLKQVLWLNTKSCMRVFSIMLMYLGFGWFRKHEKTLRGLDFFPNQSLCWYIKLGSITNKVCSLYISTYLYDVILLKNKRTSLKINNTTVLHHLNGTTLLEELF